MKKRKQKRKQKMSIVFLIGFCCCCFPLISNLWEWQQQSNVVSTYEEIVRKQEKTVIERVLEDAKKYNEKLYQSEGLPMEETENTMLEDENYLQQLKITETSVMGGLDIPKINVELPIYHGTDMDTLSSGVGHLQGTSLPIGGENTHSVLTGHRGLPSSKLLVRLDELKKGDLFFIRSCGEILAYEVEQIQTVKPEDTSSLKIISGRELVSIVTCTPYGINTHRLIVTGHRIPYEKEEYDQISESFPSIRELVVTFLPLCLAIVMLGIRIREWRRQRVYNRKKKIRERGRRRK